MRKHCPWLLTALLLTLSPAASAQRPGEVSATGTHANEWHHDLTSARRLSFASGRLILVDLYADWCGWCKALDRQVFATERFQSYAADRFVLLRVDTMDRGEGSQLKSRYGVETLPTILLLDGNMVEIGRIQGFAPLPTFIGDLNAKIARHNELLSMFERYRDSDEPEILETLAAEMLSRQDGQRAAHLLTRRMELGGLSETRRRELEHQRQRALELARIALEAQETFSSTGEASDESS